MRTVRTIAAASITTLLMGSLVGAVLTQFWPALIEFFPHPVVTAWPGALIPSFGLSCLTIWAVSLLTQPNEGYSATGKAG